MAFVDPNLSSGIKGINLEPLYVIAQKKAMPIIQSNAMALNTPGLSGQDQ